MHRIPSKMNFAQAQSITQRRRLDYSVPFPRHHMGWGESQKPPCNTGQVWASPSASTLQCGSGTISWRRKRWKGRRDGQGAARAFGWCEWSHRWCSHTFACSTGAPWEPDIWWASAPMQSLCPWNTAQHLPFVLAQKQSSERKIVILVAGADID